MITIDAHEIDGCLDFVSCIAVIEQAFRSQGLGEFLPTDLCGVEVENGGFHVKAAAMRGARSWFVAKTNANFPGNPARGLPAIQGLALLFDAETGTPLAVLDSAALTVRRTAAATAVAARHLARPDARVLTVSGCGVQGCAHMEALCTVLPIERIFAHDADPGTARRVAHEMEERLEVTIVPITDLAPWAQVSDVCVTCTPSTRWLLGPDDVRPGSFIAGVGADNPHKHELAPGLLARARVVVDHLDQCARMGDLHHAIDAGVLTIASVHADLGAIVAGRRPGRTADDEIFVFDSTGVALEDVAAAALVYERATH